MKVIQQSLVCAAASTNGLAAGVSGATFTLAAHVSGDGLAHKGTVKNNTVNDHSAKTIAFVGLDENGNYQTETIAGPGPSATVTTTKFFSYFTSITPSATIGADTFDLGWAVTATGPWVTPDLESPLPFNMGIGCSISGTPNYTLKYTYDRSTWFTHGVITGKTAAADGSQTVPCAALRIEFAAAGTVVATFMQAGAH